MSRHARCARSPSSSPCAAVARADAAAARPARPARRVRHATLVLDFTPNAVHAGIYSAIARHYDRRDGVRLNVVVPSATTDSIKLLDTGRVNFAILDIHDLAIARERGAGPGRDHGDRPAAAGRRDRRARFPDPDQLEGRTVGITGVPSDTAVLDSIVAGAGGDPHRSVRSRSASTPSPICWPAAWRPPPRSGTTRASRSRNGVRDFTPSGSRTTALPPIRSWSLCATRATLRHDPTLAARPRSDARPRLRLHAGPPAQSAADLESRVTGLDPSLVGAQLAALLPVFAGAGGRVGVLDPRTLRSWATWEARFGIVRRRPDVATTFDSGVAASAAPPSR